MKSYTGKGYTIYCHENRINGKIYIGQTKAEDLTRRWTGGNGYKGCPHFYAAIQKYGWKNFTHSILKTGLTKEEADAYEKIYISFFGADDENRGYNIQEGGHHSSTISEEGRKRLSEFFSGGNSPVARPVVLFDLTGHKIAEFACIRDCSNAIGCSHSTLNRHCLQNRGTVVGFICKFKDIVGDISQLPPEDIYRPGDRRRQNKAVAQYDMDGHFLRSFSSVKEAGSLTGTRPPDISSVINGSRQAANGFQWCLYSGDDSDIAAARVRGAATRGGAHYHARPILQLDPVSGQVIQEFPSLADAKRTVPHCHSRQLDLALKDPWRLCAGYRWAYKDKN